jgi:hypothetical protein
MSIAILAPEKFDFQDLVCIEMILRFYDRTGFEFRIEPDGGEDAEMIFFRSGNDLVRFEIQVKGAKGNVSLDNIAECLAHFPSREVTNSLFERLLTDSNRFVILVMSGRCNDASSVYLSSSEWDGEPHILNKIKKTDAEILLTSLVEILKTETSKLKTKRHMNLQNIARGADLDTVRSALCRLIVIENVDESTLMEKCEVLLRKRHRIPIDRAGNVIAQLRSIVKTAKAEQNDAIAGIRSELTKFSPPNLRPVEYIPRGSEKEWIDALSNSSALLISGPPRVGKTSVTRWIAAEFEEMGYAVKEAFDIEAAERFLLEPIVAHRIALLDDPLGGAHSATDPLRIYSRIKELVPRLKSDRKLVVAQAQDRLFEITKKANLSDLSVAGIPWLDLGVIASEFSCKLWQQLGDRYNISEPLFTIVLDALNKNKLNLEAGCLVHLAVDGGRLENTRDLAKVIRLAREDASDLGQALSEEVSKTVLMGLAATTSPGHPITETELAFVLGQGGNKLLGISKIQGSMVSFGGGRKCITPQDNPAYELLPQLSNEDQEVLDKLELRRIIEWFEHERLSFSHPFYRAAAETLFSEATRRSAQIIKTLLERGIFNLSPTTSRAAARNINWIYERLTTKADRLALIQIAIDALDSSYPSTRDICFGFLIRQLPDLPAELRDDLPTWVNKVTWTSLSLVEWIEGEPRFPMGNNLVIEENLIEWTEDDSGIAKILSLLNGTSATKITPECAWAALKFYNNKSEAITACAMSRLLSYDEALIRAQAINIWLKHSRENDADILERIFMDDHPAIAKAALKGAILAWNDCNETRQVAILDGLRKFSTSPASASAMIDPLLVFERDTYTGTQTPWSIFEVVLPEVLTVLPESAPINDARLFNVINHASSQLSIESMFRIIDSWIGILERIAPRRVLSDFKLGVTQILVRVTKNSPERRLKRVNRLLSLYGTAALACVIADLVDNWQYLTGEEKSSIIAILREKRIDGHWLRGIVLTRRQVPSILEREILPDGLALSDGARSLIQNLPPELLSAAVKVYIGSPQPLWYIGTHHQGQAIWKEVVEKIAEDPTHALFEIAWEEITMGGDGKRVSDFVMTAGTSHSEKVFEQLLRHKLRTNGDFMPEAWDALLALAPDSKTRSSWIESMASYANTALNDLSEAKLWLSGENLKEFLGHFSQDNSILKLVLKFYDISKEISICSDSEIKRDVLSIMLFIFEKAPPLHHGTCSRLKTLMQKMGYSSMELIVVEEYRKSIIETQISPELPEPEKIDCWEF